MINMDLQITDKFAQLIVESSKLCSDYRHQYIMPEHVLAALSRQSEFLDTIEEFGIDPDDLTESINDFLDQQEVVPDYIEDYAPESSNQFKKMMATCALTVLMSGGKVLSVPHIVFAFMKLNPDESFVRTLFDSLCGERFDDFMKLLTEKYSESEKNIKLGWGANVRSNGNMSGIELMRDMANERIGRTNDNPFAGINTQGGNEGWKRWATCLNETYMNHNQLVGRESELERTIQVLCRKDKNNPLHVGDPGVGKTALAYGLTAKIVAGDVPERLIGAKVYLVDMATMIAGAAMRGEFEQRMKSVLDGVKKEAPNNIIYIDEIHNIVGGHQDGSLDGADLLKPYLEDGSIRFIGSTTYEEYNRKLMRSGGIVRRFQMIDIPEPSVEETKKILHQLAPSYEKFHKIKYADGAVDYAVEASAKHIIERRLPDKAIDLIDEAGSAMEISEVKKKLVTKKLINDVLQKTCKIQAETLLSDSNESLKTLYERISSKVFGQDDAVKHVVESVQMSKAGLLDENKPLASLLFVGPTGVGKTEVAKVLAHELGVELVRFDMSEYTEKHTVAKLIGSPAGYIGYEDGGLLTDAIRKSPNCVLLLDEIEKAHQDIYNILLQVMDYARLTDNKGRKADFRNVVVIMTSNAGAQYASQASVGFTGNVSRGEAMLKQIKKTFKPEFINRLSGTVVFRDMNKEMATRILNKKLGELQTKLTAKKVTMNVTHEAFENILNEGYVPEYGAREMDRVIAQRLKPLLMREILFGTLTSGGNIDLILENGELKLKETEEDGDVQLPS